MLKKMNATFAIPYITILPSDSRNVPEEHIISIMNKASEELSSTDSLMYGIILSDNNKEITSWFTNFYQVEFSIKYGLQQKGDLRKIQKKLTSQLIHLSIQETINDNDENIASLEQGFFDIKLGKAENRRIYRIVYSLINNNENESQLFLEEYIQNLNNVLNEPA